MGLLGQLPQTGQSRKVHIRVVGHDDGTPLTGLSFKNGRHDHATGLTCSELDTVFGVAEETDLVGSGRLQGSQARDHPIGVTIQKSAKPINQRSKGQKHKVKPVRRTYLVAEALSALMTFSVMSCLGLM